MKIYSLKTMHLLRRKLYHQQKSDPVTDDHTENKTEEQASPSKSISPTKQVWKVKVKSILDSTQEEVQPVPPLEPSKVPQKD
jgi:hypothetical protein